MGAACGLQSNWLDGAAIRHGVYPQRSELEGLGYTLITIEARGCWGYSRRNSLVDYGVMFGMPLTGIVTGIVNGYRSGYRNGYRNGYLLELNSIEVAIGYQRY